MCARSLIAAAVLLASAAPSGAQTGAETDDMGQLVYQAAQKMIDHFPTKVAHTHPIAITTIVSVDNLRRSSSFGRLASELVLSKVAQNGYLVQDVNYQHWVDISRSTGQLALSRDARRLARQINAQAVIVGTYAVGGRQIYLSLRTLDATSGAVLSTADVEIPNDRDTGELLSSAGWVVRY